MNDKTLAEFIGTMREAGSLDELRESMKNFGWVKEFPALRDEHGVVLVGNRRMAVANELGIEPVVKDMRFGSGTAADAERVKLALVSNIGARPFQPSERQSIAKHLYGERQWTMQRIAEALNVSKATVSGDLRNCSTAEQLKPAKTASNPKGAGRPKGSKLRAETAPKAVQREERVAILMDAGKNAHEIADDIGLGVRAANQAMEHVKIRREAEAIIDPATLSLSAQRKLATAIKQHSRKLDASFERQVTDEIRRRMDEITLPHWKQQIEEAKRIYEHRKGIMDKATFNKIRRALHPDSRNSISDKVLSDAFDAFMRLEKFLLNEKDSPTDIARLPSTLAEWDAMKQKASAERRAKRSQSANVARRH